VWTLVVAALAVVAPFAVRGIACGHDLTFHMNGWMEVAQQWREGVVYPRWAAYANYGSGEPRFLFYPPLSGMLGGLLGSFIPWMFTPVAFDVCAVVLSGIAMRALAAEWFGEPEATLMAVAYAVNPYMLLDIYLRSDFAEMLAAALLPLLVLWIVRERPARQMLVPLALTFAAAWLTDVPAAIICTYVCALLLVMATVFRRNSRVLLFGAGAMALGLALAAFYIVPVLHEKSWITLSQALSEGLRPEENFLFTRTGEPGHDAFMRALAWLALAEIGCIAVGALAARRWRSWHPKLSWPLLALLVMASVLMTPVATLAYRFLPELRFLQFPWRWLMVVSAVYAIFAVSGVPQFRGKAYVYAAAFLAIVAGCNLALQPQCDPEDTPFMVAEVYHTGYGYMGTDEYTPAGADNYEIKPDFPEFRLRSQEGGAAPADARATHLHWSTCRKQITVESPQPVEMVLRLMNYPAWRVEVNGGLVVPTSDDPTGRMVIALPAGHSQVDVRFARTPDRWLGDSISVAALLFLCGFWYRERRSGR
jgi:6-pyruvoyl-tetrahydropterin synthase related domain